MLGGGVNPASREETLYLREYILSQDMMDLLDQKLHWNKHYEGRWQDPFYWLGSSESKENQLAFYQRVVSATFDEETGLLTVQVQAFNGEFAQQALKVILAQSEHFVNELSHRMARDQMAFAESELGRARKHYEDQREAMLRFQAANNLLDPETTAASRAQIISGLEASLTNNHTRLNALLSSLNESAPQVMQLRAQIRATEAQLVVENRRLLSAPAGDKLNVVAARFRSMMIDAKIAEDAYKASISAMETNRIEAAKKLRSLIVVVSPNLPDMALYPKRIYDLITVLIGLILAYGIVRFVIATIEDHRD
jgi:capsular polysaccharide transport system permease protein